MPDARRKTSPRLVPQQKVTVDEAVHAYTTGSAYAEFAENVKVLAVGKLADLVMIDRDIYHIDPAEIDQCM